MKRYSVKVLREAKDDLDRYVHYLKNVKKSRQAANNLMQDFVATRKVLSNVAGSIREPDSDALKKRNLKRINFRKHNYFLLYKIVGDKVFVTNMFHGSEDYENKLG